MSSFFNKLKRKGSADKISIGSNSSLFGNGAIVFSPYTVNEKQLHPFLKAVWRNDLNKVKKLMKKHYNQVDQEKRSGFHLACASGNLDIIKELMSNYRNEILEKRDINNKTGLFKAVEKGILENVQYLIEKSAKTEIKDDKGESLLHAAVRYKHDDVLEFLLKKNIDPNDVNTNGMAPLHIAAELNFVDGMKLLHDYNGDINVQNLNGKTPLILATESGHKNAVTFLLSNAADKNIEDKAGYNALYYAKFHQQTDCIKLLENTKDLKPSPVLRTPVTLETPEFLASINADTSDRISKDENREHQPKKIEPQPRGSKYRRSNSKESINSNSSWMGDFQSLSSDATNPVTHNSIAINDISTPSSMLNPSDMVINKSKPIPPNPDKGLKKQVSEDEESQWSDHEDVYQTPIKNEELKPTHAPVDASKTTDSDWDSDDTEHQNVQVELSIIEEESAGKRSQFNTMKSSQLNQDKTTINSDMSLLGLPTNEEDHQTDSNIDECYEANCLVTNPPIRYDSVDALNNSMDEDSDNDLSEMYATQIRINSQQATAPPNKPPKSPSVIPTITIEEFTPKNRSKFKYQASGDNLSYSSSDFDLNSRNGSMTESDSLNDRKKTNVKSVDEYIKRCAQLESKLRDVQSENAKLQLNINSINESNKKSEAKKSKMLSENQQLEARLSEKNDELSDYKLKFITAEDHLKKREKELFEVRNDKVELEKKYNDLEFKNIALNSKNKQLEEKLESFQSNSQNNLNNEEDLEKYKKKHEEDLKNWIQKNDDLKKEISNLKEQIIKNDNEMKSVKSEQKEKTQNLLNQIDDFKESIKKEQDEKESLQEEIDQLRKTIKNLNTDLESSSKSVALLSKKEREIDELKKSVRDLESKISQLSTEKESLSKTVGDKEKNMNSFQNEKERLENQLKLKDEKISHLEMQYKTYESQSRELEKIIERKTGEIREYENRLHNTDMELKKELKRNNNALEIVNDAINTAIYNSPDPSEILEKLQNIRKAISNLDIVSGAPLSQMKPVTNEADLTIELSKSRSQIRVLQEQIEKMRKNLNDVSDEQSSNEEYQSEFHQINSTKSFSPFKQIIDLLLIEVERIDKLEHIEQQLYNDLQGKTRIIQNNQQELTQLDRENIQLKEQLKEEKQRYQLIQEKDKSLSNQLRNEIKKKKELSELLDSVKYWIDKYSKQVNIPTNNSDHPVKVLTHSDSIENVSSIPNECSTLLQKLTDMNDDLKVKLKKIESDNLEFQSNKSSTTKSHEMMNENSQFILNQQLSELTQMMENQRLNREKLEKIRDENEFQLRNELYQTKQQKMMELSQLTSKLAMIEEERNCLNQKIECLNDILSKERQLKDSLTEQMVNLMKSSHGSSQVTYGYEPVFQNGNGFNGSLTQFSTPLSVMDLEKKRYANSMLNLSMVKPIGIEDEDLRQKLRQELDRSIAKHLESGKSIQHLNIKDKIKSLNNGRYSNGYAAWKSP